MKQCKIKFCFISGMQFLTVIRKPFDFMDMVWPNSNLNYTRMPSYDEYCVIAPLEKIFFRQLETSINFLMTTKVVMQTFESLLLRKWTNTLLSTTGNHCLNQGEGGGGVMRRTNLNLKFNLYHSLYFFEWLYCLQASF